MGAFSPLEGFLAKEDYESIVANMRLKSGLLWPIPINLAVSREEADKIKYGQSIALVNDENNEPMASLIFEDKYSYDKHTEALQVFTPDDDNHPGVRTILYQVAVYLVVHVKVLR